MLWLDKACIDNTNIEESLQCLPIYLMSCDTMLVLAGDTYLTRLWCVWELYVLYAITDGAPNVVLRDLQSSGRSAGATRSNKLLEDLGEFKVGVNTTCYDPNEEAKLLAAIRTAPCGEAGFNRVVHELASVLAGCPKHSSSHHQHATHRSLVPPTVASRTGIPDCIFPPINSPIGRLLTIGAHRKHAHAESTPGDRHLFSACGCAGRRSGAPTAARQRLAPRNLDRTFALVESEPAATPPSAACRAHSALPYTGSARSAQAANALRSKSLSPGKRLRAPMLPRTNGDGFGSNPHPGESSRLHLPGYLPGLLLGSRAPIPPRTQGDAFASSPPGGSSRLRLPVLLVDGEPVATLPSAAGRAHSALLRTGSARSARPSSVLPWSARPSSNALIARSQGDGFQSNTPGGSSRCRLPVRSPKAIGIRKSWP